VLARTKKSPPTTKSTSAETLTTVSTSEVRAPVFRPRQLANPSASTSEAAMSGAT